MGFSIPDYNQAILAPTLQWLGLDSFQARLLLLGTIAAETAATHFIQWHGGPALGFFQIEPATLEDIKEQVLKPHRDRFCMFLDQYPLDKCDKSLLLYDLKFSAAICRLNYWRFPEKIPSSLDGLAQYWKQYHNTKKGAGTLEHFKRAYKSLIEFHEPQIQGAI